MADCFFCCHESEGFAGRFSMNDCDLCTLTMWNIKFADSTVISAYPEEIILSERKNNRKR